MNKVELEAIVQAIKVSIDATNPDEVALIANLNKAIELLNTYATKEQL